MVSFSAHLHGHRTGFLLHGFLSSVHRLKVNAVPRLASVSSELHVRVIATGALLFATQLLGFVHAKRRPTLAARNRDRLRSTDHAWLEAHHGGLHVSGHGLINWNGRGRSAKLGHIALVSLAQCDLHELGFLFHQIGFELRIFLLLQLTALLRDTLLLVDQLGDASLFIGFLGVVCGDGDGVLSAVLFPLLLRSSLFSFFAIDQVEDYASAANGSVRAAVQAERVPNRSY